MARLTLTFEDHEVREAIAEYARSHHGLEVESISMNTDYLDSTGELTMTLTVLTPKKKGA